MKKSKRQIVIEYLHQNYKLNELIEIKEQTNYSKIYEDLKNEYDNEKKIRRYVKELIELLEKNKPITFRLSNRTSEVIKSEISKNTQIKENIDCVDIKTVENMIDNKLKNLFNNSRNTPVINSNKKRFSFSLNEKNINTLRDIAKTKNLSYSELVDSIIEQWITLSKF